MASHQTPLLGQFLVNLNGFITARNENGITDWLVLEPPWNDHYAGMIRELQTAYPRNNEAATATLEQKCSDVLTAAAEGADGSPWTAFAKFMALYLAYLRDVSADVDKYLQTYELLSELQQRANSALGHASLGYLMLGTVVRCAKCVCRLAIGLDKRPDLIAHLRRSGGSVAGGGGEEGGPRETLPERAANILRQAFVTCLNDRAPPPSTTGDSSNAPQGKKKGIYQIANLCLKILFQCRKTRTATQLFENISHLSPPLALYPKAQRITYLYYLGRFYFQNSHFFRAQAVLQHAYDEAPRGGEAVRQRRLILIFLIASNIILGRFPSEALLQRPEASGLREKFLPLCMAIKQGDLARFRQHLALEGAHASWFLHFRILLQLRNRCEPLIWRSLARRTFIIAGYRPPFDPNSQKAATLDLRYLVAAFAWLDHLSSAHPNGPSAEIVDADFAGVPPSAQGNEEEESEDLALLAVESKVSSLITQSLLSGYLSHRQKKFAIQGAKAKGGDAVAAGFPRVWEVFGLKAEREGGEVVGWKRVESSARGGGAANTGWRGSALGPGMVVNLSGARPIGAMG